MVDEGDDGELPVRGERNAQFDLAEQFVGSVIGIGVPAQLLVREHEQLVGRYGPGRIADHPVKAERDVVGQREELGHVDGDDLVIEVRRQGTVTHLVADRGEDAAARVEDVVAGVGAQSEHEAVQTVGLIVVDLRDRRRGDAVCV